MDGLGVANTDCRPAHSPLDPANGRASYLFNTSIAGIEDADAIMLIGTNPRKEATVLNARIRKRFVQGGVEVGLIGENADLTYPVTYCGAGPESMARRCSTTNPTTARPNGRWSSSARAPSTGRTARRSCRWQPSSRSPAAPSARTGTASNVLHSAAATVGGLDVGFVPGEGGLDTAGMVAAAGKGDLDVLFLMGADEIDMQALGETFVVYIGSHGDAGAHRADVILPGAAYTEKSGLYVNTEGRVQLGLRAAFPPGEAREDWAILRALSAELGAKLPFDTLVALRAALVAAHPHFALVDEIAEADPKAVEALAQAGGSVDGAPFEPWIDDFYLTNPIARASKVMAECSALAHGLQAEAAE